MKQSNDLEICPRSLTVVLPESCRVARGVYPYLPMATNAPWSILGENEKSTLGGMKKFNIKSVNLVHKFN